MHPRAVLSPISARVMAAAVELRDLNVSHGEVGVVCGFDHSPLNAAQVGWEDNSFPYCLGGYRHAFLSAPFVLATLDYTVAVAGNGAAVSTGIGVGSDAVPLSTGRCHAVVVWVDYELTEGEWLESYWYPSTITITAGTATSSGNGSDIPPYLKTPLRFIRDPESGGVGRDVSPEHALVWTSSLPPGASDFSFSFEIVPL